MKTVSSNSKGSEAFYQELSIMSWFIGKENFVQLLGYSESPFCILMEYYYLGALTDILFKSMPLIQTTKHLSLNFSLQISSALAMLHQSGFAHSDLKLHNVFLKQRPLLSNAKSDLVTLKHFQSGMEYVCVLGDFGIAKVVDDSVLRVKAYHPVNAKGLTIAYAAPEILRKFRNPVLINTEGGDYFKRSDVFSLAIVVYELLSASLVWT